MLTGDDPPLYVSQPLPDENRWSHDNDPSDTASPVPTATDANAAADTGAANPATTDANAAANTGVASPNLTDSGGSGTSGTASSLQPYYVVTFWKRVA